MRCGPATGNIFARKERFLLTRYAPRADAFVRTSLGWSQARRYSGYRRAKPRGRGACPSGVCSRFLSRGGIPACMSRLARHRMRTRLVLTRCVHRPRRRGSSKPWIIETCRLCHVAGVVAALTRPPQLKLTNLATGTRMPSRGPPYQ